MNTICSLYHISALAVYANQNLPDTKGIDVEALGCIFFDQNKQAVEYRYSKEYPDLFRFDSRSITNSKKHTPAQIIKAVDWYQQQSCLNYEWMGSIAKSITDKIRNHAIRTLPGYRESSWDLNPWV